MSDGGVEVCTLLVGVRVYGVKEGDEVFGCE